MSLGLALCMSGAFAQSTPKKISLEEAIREAMQHSPILIGAKSDADVAVAVARSARAGTLPQLAANGFAASGNNSSFMFSTPSTMPPVGMLLPTGTFLDANLALMIPLIAPGLQSAAASANWQERAARGDLSEALAELILQVTKAYDRVLLWRQMILAEQSKVSEMEELVRTSQALLDAGKGIEANVQRSRAELSRAQRALTTARNEESKAILDLQAAMGADMSSPLDPDGILVTVANTGKLDDYLGRSKQLRGSLVAARARREAAGSEIKKAQAQRTPQLYGAVMGDATNRTDMGGLSAGITMSFPLFDGGRIGAEVSQARSTKAKAEADLRQAELTVEREVRQAWLDVGSAKSNAISAEATVSAAQSAYDVVVLRVSAGKSILLEQLDALEALVRAKADLAQATFDQVVATATLSRAAGGLN